MKFGVYLQNCVSGLKGFEMSRSQIIVTIIGVLYNIVMLGTLYWSWEKFKKG